MSVSPDFRLDGKRALVTGAGRGIGRAIAEAFAECGAEVVLCARTRSEIEEAADALKARGLAATALVCDVMDVEGFSDLIENQAPFDILVNNAGTNRPKPQSEVTEEDYDAVMNLNVRAVYFATKAVAKSMIAAGRGGSIMTLSSQMGHVGATNRTIYCASKWAIEGFTKALACELGPHKIRVNTICPTFIETPMTKPYFEDETFKNAVLSKIKLGRIGQVSDVTGAAVFLASNASGLMTGSAVMLDGGWTAE